MTGEEDTPSLSSSCTWKGSRSRPFGERGKAPSISGQARGDPYGLLCDISRGWEGRQTTRVCWCGVGGRRGALRGWQGQSRDGAWGPSRRGLPRGLGDVQGAHLPRSCYSLKGPALDPATRRGIRASEKVVVGWWRPAALSRIGEKRTQPQRGKKCFSFLFFLSPNLLTSSPLPPPPIWGPCSDVCPVSLTGVLFFFFFNLLCISFVYCDVNE